MVENLNVILTGNRQAGVADQEINERHFANAWLNMKRNTCILHFRLGEIPLCGYRGGDALKCILHMDRERTQPQPNPSFAITGPLLASRVVIVQCDKSFNIFKKNYLSRPIF